MQQEPVISKVKLFLERYNLYNKVFVVGFSGGYDSMCLLDILSGLDIKPVAAHYNHGWRPEANYEEERCREFCKSRGIEFYSEHAPADLPKTETAAREVRYDFFERVSEKYHADGIFTAHNCDDNVETVIYRIIKGTGITGLKGIQEVRGNIYRPILNCSRAEIEEYCKTHKLTPNTDSSNTNNKYKRNFIRHKIIPAMEEINAELKSSVNKLSELARLDDNIIQEYIKEIKKKTIKENCIIIPEFIKLSDALMQKIVYTQLSNYLEEYDFKRVRECLDFILQNCNAKQYKKKSLTTNIWLTVNKDKAVIYKEEENVHTDILITSCGRFNFNDKYTLVLEKSFENINKYPPDSCGIAYIDLSEIQFPLVLRYGKNDDIIKPLGMNGKMLLKKYLSGKSVPVYMRKNIPVLVNDNEVLWVPEIGLSRTIAVKNKPTHRLKFFIKTNKNPLDNPV